MVQSANAKRIAAIKAAMKKGAKHMSRGGPANVKAAKKRKK